MVHRGMGKVVNDGVSSIVKFYCQFSVKIFDSFDKNKNNPQNFGHLLFLVSSILWGDSVCPLTLNDKKCHQLAFPTFFSRQYCRTCAVKTCF